MWICWFLQEHNCLENLKMTDLSNKCTCIYWTRMSIDVFARTSYYISIWNTHISRLSTQACLVFQIFCLKRWTTFPPFFHLTTLSITKTTLKKDKRYRKPTLFTSKKGKTIEKQHSFEYVYLVWQKMTPFRTQDCVIRGLYDKLHSQSPEYPQNKRNDSSMCRRRAVTFREMSKLQKHLLVIAKIPWPTSLLHDFLGTRSQHYLPVQHMYYSITAVMAVINRGLWFACKHLIRDASTLTTNALKNTNMLNVPHASYLLTGDTSVGNWLLTFLNKVVVSRTRVMDTATIED